MFVNGGLLKRKKVAVWMNIGEWGAKEQGFDDLWEDGFEEFNATTGAIVWPPELITES